MRRATDFQSIRSEGGLLPPDLLRRVLDPKAKLDGMGDGHEIITFFLLAPGVSSGS